MWRRRFPGDRVKWTFISFAYMHNSTGRGDLVIYPDLPIRRIWPNIWRIGILRTSTCFSMIWYIWQHGYLRAFRSHPPRRCSQVQLCVLFQKVEFASYKVPAYLSLNWTTHKGSVPLLLARIPWRKLQVTNYVVDSTVFIFSSYRCRIRKQFCNLPISQHYDNSSRIFQNQCSVHGFKYVATIGYLIQLYKREKGLLVAAGKLV